VAPTQNGTIDVALNSTLNVTPVWANGGALVLNGGFLVGGNVTNSATARIAGFGTASNTVVNFGILTATNGTLNLVNAPLQNGTANIAALGTLNVMQAWNNAGTVNMFNGTLIGGNISNNASRLIAGSGTINPNVYNGGQILANDPSRVLTLNNSLVNLVGGVVAANTGNLVINGTFTNAGTLKHDS